jgi:hypothetical protein
MSGASTVPDTLIGLRQGSADRVPLPPRSSLPTPRAPTRDTALDQQVRQRLAESLQVMLDRVLDGTMELSLIPGAGRAAVLEHGGIRAILVIDPGAGNGYCLSPRECRSRGWSRRGPPTGASLSLSTSACGPSPRICGGCSRRPAWSAAPRWSPNSSADCTSPSRIDPSAGQNS